MGSRFRTPVPILVCTVVLVAFCFGDSVPTAESSAGPELGFQDQDLN